MEETKILATPEAYKLINGADNNLTSAAVNRVIQLFLSGEKKKTHVYFFKDSPLLLSARWGNSNKSIIMICTKTRWSFPDKEKFDLLLKDCIPFTVV